ncbi:MAG: hypothetical protein ACQKBU_11585, partial [Verrucomicrobiales bacterium]
QANATILALQTEMEALRSAPDSLRAQLIEAQTRQSDLEIANRQLQGRIRDLETQINRASLFAKDESELLKEAIALFRALKTLQRATPSEMAAAYAQFGAELGASVLQICKFATGSSEVSPDLQMELSALPGQVPPGALFLVVGYASE